MVLVALLALPAGAVGHAQFRGAEPADGAVLAVGPASVRLSFDAPVETAFLRAAVLARDGRTVSAPAGVDAADPQAVVIAMPRSVLPEGGYRVVWRVMSTDGHVTAGSARFTVARAPPVDEESFAEPPELIDRSGDWVAGLGRALVLLGALTSLGLVALRWLVAGPAWAQGGLAPPGRPGEAEPFRVRAAVALRASAPGWWRVWTGSAAVWGAGAVLVAAGTLVAARAGAGGLGDLAGTRLGHGLLVALAAAVVAGVAGLALRRRPAAAEPLPAAGPAALLAAPAALGLGAMSWMGHASTGNDATLNISADVLHNLATAAWIGGLAGLLALLLPAGEALDVTDRVRLVAPAVVRFSSLALGSVAVLVVTGVYRALAELSALGDLLHTGYGRALAVKLGVFAVMLAVGGYNRFALHPRLERAALGLPGGDAAATRALARSVRVELVLAALLLVAVGVLVSSAPPA